MIGLEEKCKGCVNCGIDKKGISVEYCSPKGPLTGKNINDFPENCGSFYKPRMSG